MSQAQLYIRPDTHRPQRARSSRAVDSKQPVESKPRHNVSGLSQSEVLGPSLRGSCIQAQEFELKSLLEGSLHQIQGSQPLQESRDESSSKSEREEEAKSIHPCGVQNQSPRRCHQCGPYHNTRKDTLFVERSAQPLLANDHAAELLECDIRQQGSESSKVVKAFQATPTLWTS